MWEHTYKREEACSRMHLAYLSERDRRAGNATALDVGLADEYKVVGEKKVRACVPFLHACRYRSYWGGTMGSAVIQRSCMLHCGPE